MTTHSSTLAWQIPWMEETGRLQTMGSLGVRHSSKASILQCSAFFIVQLSHLYVTTSKTIDLTVQTFLSKVMSLLFSTLLGLS